MKDIAHPERVEIGDGDARFVLRERWAPGPLIGFAGMNPSKASADTTDPTWNAWRGFATRWGYGGQIVVNPVAKRSSDPDDAIAWLRLVAADRAPEAAAMMARNLAEVRLVAAEPQAWVLGWGDKGAKMNDTFRCHRPFIDALREGGAKTFLAFGLTKNRNPKHVLARGVERIPADVELRHFDHIKRQLGDVFEHPIAK